MLKLLIINILSLVVISATLRAQTPARNSVMKIAQADARHFRLDKARLKQFRKDRNRYADYFKPDKTMVSDTLLLQDSTYVRAFRAAAYERTRHPAYGRTLYMVGQHYSSGYGYCIIFNDYYSDYAQHGLTFQAHTEFL